MDKLTIAEEAYKRGYEKGREDATKHGYWDRWWCDNYLQYSHRCSRCGADALTKEGTMYDEVLSGYCPNCGAKMDGGAEDG